MALRIITVALFTVFFSEALTLMCSNCSTTLTTVPSATCTANCSSSSQCSSMTTYNHVNVTKSCAAACVNWTINVGVSQMSSKCCSSDFCNNATASDSENGLSCYTCVGINCKNTLKCKGAETKCITAAAVLNGTNFPVKGCASQNICNNSALVISTLPPGLNIFNVSCLEANQTTNATQAPVSAGTSTFPTFFHLKSGLGGFLLGLLVFGCSVLSM